VERATAALRIGISVVRVGGTRIAGRLLTGNDAPRSVVAAVGDELVYTIVVRNGGPAAATNVRLDDQLSANTVLEQIHTTHGSCSRASATSVNCTLGTIPARRSATVTVKVRATSGGVVTNTATVVADQPPTNTAALRTRTRVTVTPSARYGHTFNLFPVSGKVSYRLPHHVTYQPLVNLTSVPARTEINASHGTAGLVSARNPANTRQAGKFTGARFVVSYGLPAGTKHGRKTLLVTRLRLSAPLTCARRRLAAATAHSRPTRRLWGNGKGNFETRGRYAAATVRGTHWHTTDTCTTTTIYVRHGRVDVYDYLRHRHVFVTTEHKYTASRH
jgi:uncharacterized repeat protein (TIGR01451 family)